MVVCKKSVILFVFYVIGCVGGAVLNISISENLHIQRYYLLLIVSKTIKLAMTCAEHETSSPLVSKTSPRKGVSPVNN